MPETKAKEETVGHFRALVAEETERLEALCTRWSAVLKQQEAEKEDQQQQRQQLDEETEGQVRAAVGLARLLVAQRFRQFTGLVEDHARGSSPPVTRDDLAGFWAAMVSPSIHDILAKFDQLDSAVEPKPVQ